MSRTASLLIVPLLCVSFGGSQTRSTVESKGAELRLITIPDKGTHSLHDEIFTKIEFTNVSNLTLCFPEPAQGYVAASEGVLTRRLVDPGGQEDDRFIEVFDGGGAWPREKLVEEIKTRWIHLAPNAKYVTKSSRVGKLDAVGKWQLETSYRPPEGSFKPAAYRKYLASAARQTGCTLPEMDASAEKIDVIVSP